MSGIISLFSLPVGITLGVVPPRVGAAFLAVLLVYGGAILLTALVNFARAPFIVLGENQRRIASLEQSLGTAAVALATPAIPRLVPNLVCLGRECTLGEIDEDDGVLKPNGRADSLLMMAEIKNEILDDREIGDADFVSAQIVYRRAEHVETVHHGVWLGEQLSFTEIPTDAVRHLILAIAAPDHGLLTLDNYNERYDRLEGFRQIDLEREPYEITVTVREGARNMLTAQFRLEYNANVADQEDQFNLVHLPAN